MNEPLIILGAGASYDFIPKHSQRGSVPIMPMTNNLVDGDQLNYTLATRYPAVKNAMSRISSMIKNADGDVIMSFEDAVQDITDTDQIVALRYYLSDLFQTLSNDQHWSQQLVNNYQSLIGHIIEGKAKGACVVTFNYDTLFENQFSDGTFREMNDYISSGRPIKLIKVHGSSDWFYLQQKNQYVYHDTSDNTAYNFSRKQPNYKTPHFHTKRILEDCGTQSEDHHWIPALALPVSGTKDFVCPDNHIEYLKSVLDKVSRVLIIGWKAGDAHILKLMQERANRPNVLFTIVSGSKEDCEQIEKILNQYIPLATVGEKIIGFSSFLGSKGCRVFFRD